MVGLKGGAWAGDCPSMAPVVLICAAYSLRPGLTMVLHVVFVDYGKELRDI